MCIILSEMPNAQDEFNIKNWPLTILYLLTVSWTFSAFGVIIGIIAKSWDEIGSFSITRIQYRGGGDWYADQSSIPNLLQFIDINTSIPVDLIEKKSKIGDDIFFRSSYLYITGHGNIKFSDREAQILRDKLLSGAFLHADDNYGMDKSFRREMKKVFPEKDWVELPLDPVSYTHLTLPTNREV